MVDVRLAVIREGARALSTDINAVPTVHAHSRLGHRRCDESSPRRRVDYDADVARSLTDRPAASAAAGIHQHDQRPLNPVCLLLLLLLLLKVDSEDYRNCSVLSCVRRLCPMMRATVCSFLSVGLLAKILVGKNTFEMACFVQGAETKFCLVGQQRRLGGKVRGQSPQWGPDV